MTNETELLVDLVKIRTGMTFRSKLIGEMSGDCYVLDSRAIDKSGQVNSDKLVRMGTTELLIKKRVTSEDVLVCSKGIRNFAIGVPTTPSIIIPTNYFLVLEEISQRILPGYLMAYLNLSKTQNELKSRSKGGLIQSLSKNNIKTLQVIVPTLSVQKLVIENLQYMIEERKVLEKLVINKKILWEEKIDRLIQQ